MFAKLLKHEWKSTRGTLGVLTLALLGLGVLASADLRIMLSLIRGNIDDPFISLLTIGMGMFLFISSVGLCVYAVGTQFMLLYRFYKNKFTDEGYLTFTLPVKTTHIFWSSFVNMLAWLAISVAAVAVVVVMVLLFGTATEGLVNTDAVVALWNVVKDIIDISWEVFVTEGMGFTAFIYFLQMLLIPFQALIIPMACITVGAVLAKKHKILAAFGVYYGISAVLGIVGSVITMLPVVVMVGSGANEVAITNVTLAMSTLLTAGVTVAGYFLSIYLMKHKLNLP